MDDHDLLARFRTFISDHQLVASHDRILIAVSGGKDSVAMLDLFHRSMIKEHNRLGVVYINHGWDPERHTKETAFVKDLAKGYSLPFHEEKIPSIAMESKKSTSLESWSRQERYRLFSKVLRYGCYNICAVGHTLDDQAETVLMRLMHGTGLLGLSGIPIKRECYIRPMMGFTSVEIINYLHSRSIPYVEDPTNQDPKFLRSRIRHQLLPMLEREYNTNVKQALVDLSHDIGQWRDEVVKTFPSPIIKEKGKIILAQSAFFSYLDIIKKIWLQEALQKATGVLYPLRRQYLRKVSRLEGEGKTGKWVMLPGNIRLLRDRESLILIPHTILKPSSMQVSMGLNFFESLGMTLNVEEKPLDAVDLSNDPFVEWMDLDHMPAPWILRTWRPGDRFHPLGASGSRKVSDFLIDQKVPRFDKHRVLVLEAAGCIIWVVGHRISHRTKITEQTKSVIRCEIRPLEPESPGSMCDEI